MCTFKPCPVCKKPIPSNQKYCIVPNMISFCEYEIERYPDPEYSDEELAAIGVGSVDDLPF